MSLVSVIVPIYNTEKYLKRCIDSLLGQTHTEIEILLIDDGSTDSSASMCDEYIKKDERIRAFYLKNGGVSSARNYGIEVMRGDFAIFVDSDDWLEPDAIEKMLELTDNAGVDLAVFPLIAEYGTYREVAVLYEGTFSPADYFSNPEQKIDYICSPCNKIYRADIIRENQVRFAKGIKFGEDFIFNAEYLKHIKMLVVSNNAYYHYDCSRDNSGVKKLYEEYGDYIIAMQEAFDTLLDLCKVKNAKKIMRGFIGPRWDYAISVCLASNIKNEKKAKIIKDWLSMVSAEDFDAYSLCNNTLGVFCRNLSAANVDEESVLALVKKHLSKERNARTIVRIKRFLRRMK